MTEYAIELNNLTKKFGDFTAVDDLSLTVKEGEIFGFLGPNGAGKSTTIRMLCTLAQPTSGSAKVAGYDLIKDSARVRENIGLVAEKMIMYDRLTAAENLRFFGKLYEIPKQKLEKRIDELLELVDMQEWKNTQISKFSTGMKQRINVIRALLPEPKIVFMDEPTLGLDPQTTFSIRDITREINDSGVTVILTTHAMVEAEALSDRVAIIDHGKVAALDTPQKLKNMITNSDTTIFGTKITNLTSDLIGKINSLDVVTAMSQQDDYNLKISAKGDDALNQIIDTVRHEGGNIASITNSNESTLEDVFLAVTGKEMRDQASEKAAPVHHGHGHTPKARVR
ncbi:MULTISPECIES: ABC transporter ATP-binding protein [Methanobacterium]|uniref:Daunorubicin ABC transporter ATP-binding protein n=1 Tax=Methanobacterium bryantii TaxID=2161 RepID=A0A2A2H538_METBR|nr:MULTISPECIES: ATP-binding cassette domain-containing protein [Methanobacterium]OEC88350.1 daunorubicin ABC transporter ATP-binding protein [Methanobacterium sp. A39]PAV04539.1 daunorubicin ABC transporter ATP-binding protein [Methanobacterium bryantii]